MRRAWSGAEQFMLIDRSRFVGRLVVHRPNAWSFGVAIGRDLLERHVHVRAERDERPRRLHPWPELEQRGFTTDGGRTASFFAIAS
jgi:hypothetical protein